ncbi:MAG: hypothetical protein H0V81_13940, partial [Solirubrobacterales bacterium]|nr:hypothetical protein [Solirubrobacterales bacterium]
MSASTAAAAPGQGAWGDRENDHGYNSPDVISTVGAWDRDVLGFEVGVTQNQIYSGDRFSVIIDANRDGIEDYALVLYCCPLQKNMGYWTGSGWNFSIPQNTFQASFGSGTMQAYVHRGEVGWPQGALHFRARTWWEGSGQRPFDLAPDSGWFVLPQETAVGGASGPGAQTAP